MKNSFPIKKDQSIWLELKASEDMDLMDCKELIDIYYEEQGLDKLEATAIIMKEDYFSGVRKEIITDLTALLLDNEVLDKRWLYSQSSNNPERFKEKG